MRSTTNIRYETLGSQRSRGLAQVVREHRSCSMLYDSMMRWFCVIYVHNSPCFATVLLLYSLSLSLHCLQTKSSALLRGLFSVLYLFFWGQHRSTKVKMPMSSKTGKKENPRNFNMSRVSYVTGRCSWQYWMVDVRYILLIQKQIASS